MMSTLSKAIAVATRVFDRAERFHFLPDPWDVASSRAQFRYRETNRIIRDHMPEVLGGTIIEIGSAEGHQTEWLSQLGSVTCIEPSLRARERAKLRVPAAAFLDTRLPAIPLKADLVCAFELLNYFQSPALDEAIAAMNEAAPHRIASYHHGKTGVTRRRLDSVILALPTVASEEISYKEHTWTIAWW